MMEVRYWLEPLVTLMCVAIKQLCIIIYYLFTIISKLPDSIVDELHLAGGVHGVEAGAYVAQVVQHHVHRHHAAPHGRHRHRVGPDVGANVWAV